MVTKISMSATLRQMRPGGVVEIPLKLRTYNYIRNCASTLGTQLGRKYSVALDREAASCKVTRLS